MCELRSGADGKLLYLRCEDIARIEVHHVKNDDVLNV